MRQNQTFLFALSMALTSAIGTSALAQTNELQTGESKPGELATEFETTQSIDRGTRFEYCRGGDDAATPYVVSPRLTLLATDRPILRWNAVRGATAYLVTVEGGGVSWSKEVTYEPDEFLTGAFYTAEVAYDGEALQPGTIYTVSVQADTGASSVEDSGSHLGFEVLPEDTTERVNEAVAAIEEVHAGDRAATALAKARLFDAANLHADAIETLETAIANGFTTVEIFAKLGDVYAQTGLNLLAAEHYRQARLRSTLGRARFNIKEKDRPQIFGVTTIDRIEARYVGVLLLLGREETARSLAGSGPMQQQEFDLVSQSNAVSLVGARGRRDRKRPQEPIAPVFCKPMFAPYCF